MGLEALKTNRLTNKVSPFIENQIAEELLTVDQLAGKLSIKTGTIYKWQNRYRDFPVIKIGTANRYYFSEVFAFFQNQRGGKNGGKKDKK